MNDEIKEILDKLQKVANRETASRNALMEMKDKDYQLLLDYITNLQAIEQEHQRINGELREENKRIRETNKIFSERIISENNPDYKARCDKALNAVRKLKQSVQSFGDEMPCWLDDFERILNGGKEWLKKLYSSL